jgi:hypothetical protein
MQVLMSKLIALKNGRCQSYWIFSHTGPFHNHCTFCKGWDVFVQNWNLCLMACCLSLLIQGMFVDLMIGTQVIYLFIYFAMINILWQIQENNKNLSEQREASTWLFKT